MLAIKGSENTLEQFNQMKLGKETAYLIFTVEGSYVEVEKSASKKDLGEEYLANFIADVKSSGQPRFAVVDWNHKLSFVAWTPDTAKARNKMTFASIKEAFSQELVGIHVKIQATDDSELNEDLIKDKTKSNV